jgi:membrane-associated phospholipid phosphatase
VTLLDRPQRLRLPPAREQRRRIRRRAEARRRPLGGAALAAGRIDQAVLLALRTRGHRPAVERFAQGLGGFGEFGLGWAALGLAGAALAPARRRRFLAAAAAAPAAVGVNFLVKLAVGRDRPVIEGHPPLGPAPNKLSFPSAHSTTAVAAATVLARVAPAARLPLFSLAALICVGRPYLGMHYPSDVLAGAVLGYGLGRAYPLPPEPPEPPASADGDGPAIEASS